MIPASLIHRDFVNTSPFFVHDSRPAEFEPGAVITDEQAEIMAARAEGARMADVSRPVPLDHDRSTQYRSSRAADRVMLALAVGTAAGWLLAKVFA